MSDFLVDWLWVFLDGTGRIDADPHHLGFVPMSLSQTQSG
jgi:hypothetical protein